VRCLQLACEMVAVLHTTTTSCRRSMMAAGMDELHNMCGELGQAHATGGLMEGGPRCRERSA